MKRLLALALAAGTAVVALSPADAAGGCGRGFHPGPHGHRCFPNGRGPGFGPGGPLVIGQMYPGRGYWDGHRYWHNRRHDHGGWRYY
jgi:hypothetical protein